MTTAETFAVLSDAEIDAVSGAGDPFSDISIALGAASVASGGLAAVPTPATPALVGFSVLTGLMSAGAAYLSSTYGGGGNNYEKEK